MAGKTCCPAFIWNIIGRLLCSGLLALALGLVSRGAVAQQKPNILFIMADDLGYGDLGCYGQPRIKTPSIDALARQGTRFTQCYAGSTVCAPSRCCLMTGFHTGHARIRDNLPLGIFLKDDDVTVAEVLKKAGYRTGAVGKWGLGVHGTEGKPNDQGFDDWFGHLDQRQAHFYYPDYLWDNDRIVLLSGNRGERKQQYSHDLFTARARRFIERSRENPFFLYLSYTIPHHSDYDRHTPESFIVPSDAPYSHQDWPQVEKNYAAMITRLDRDVGRLMKQLARLGITENTLVFFTSDNGPLGGDNRAHQPTFFGSQGGLRGVKRDLYEGGIRIPMIVRWPGHVPAGRVSDQIWAFWDLMPTLADVSGGTAPEGIDGISMLPALLGQTQEKQHRYLYWDYGHTRGNYRQAVRMGNWKGVRNGPAAPIELYNLARDVTESSDVAEQHPQQAARIEQYMREAYVESADYPIRGVGK